MTIDCAVCSYTIDLLPPMCALFSTHVFINDDVYKERSIHLVNYMQGTLNNQSLQYEDCVFTNTAHGVQ